jgi:hypothetical protein
MVKFDKLPNFNGILVEFGVEAGANKDDQKYEDGSGQGYIIMPHH